MAVFLLRYLAPAAARKGIPYRDRRDAFEQFIDRCASAGDSLLVIDLDRRFSRTRIGPAVGRFNDDNHAIVRGRRSPQAVTSLTLAEKVSADVVWNRKIRHPRTRPFAPRMRTA